MLCPEQGEYPMIQAFVSGSFGYLCYWPAEDVAGHVGTGMTPRDCPEMVHFQWGSEASGDDVDAPKANVIPAAIACEALFEFLANGCRPKSINWFEL